MEVKEIEKLLKTQRVTRLARIKALMEVTDFVPLDEKGEPLPNPYYSMLKDMWLVEAEKLRKLLINSEYPNKEQRG